MQTARSFLSVSGKTILLLLYVFVVFIVLEMFHVCNWINIDPWLDPIKKSLHSEDK